MKWSLPLLLLLIGGATLFTCKKPVLNNNGTTPVGSLSLVFTDTLTVRTYTVREDSLEGDNQAINILGTLNDPIFGNTHASIYSQFTLPINNLILSGNIIVDSVVLCLVYAGNYGNNNSPMNINVYRIGYPGVAAPVLSIDSTYQTYRTFPLYPQLLGSLSNFIPDLKDSVYLNGTKLDYDTIGHAPEMRIRLNNSLGQSIVNQANGIGTIDSSVTNNQYFQNFFNGLYITTDTSKPGKNMVYLNMGSADSHLSIYFRSDQSSNKNVDSVIYFYSNSLAKIVEHFDHNYKGSTVAKFLGSTNPKGDSLVFTQAMSGVKGKFYVPYLKNLGNIAINKAELVFTAVSDSSTYKNPIELTVNTLDSIGLDTSVADQAVSAAYFGGFKSSAISKYNNGTQYGVNLARYYQSIIQGGVDSGLYIFPFPPNRISDRVVLGGGTASPNYKVRLNLTYTKIK